MLQFTNYCEEYLNKLGKCLLQKSWTMQSTPQRNRNLLKTLWHFRQENWGSFIVCVCKWYFKPGVLVNTLLQLSSGHLSFFVGLFDSSWALINSCIRSVFTCGRFEWVTSWNKTKMSRAYVQACFCSMSPLHKQQNIQELEECAVTFKKGCVKTN